MNYEPHIIIIPVDGMSDGRRAVERIQNEKFESVEDVQNAVCFNEHDPLAVEDLRIMDLNDFMDSCNNTDDCTPEGEEVIIMDSWIGYIQIKSEKN